MPLAQPLLGNHSPEKSDIGRIKKREQLDRMGSCADRGDPRNWSDRAAFLLRHIAISSAHKFPFLAARFRRCVRTFMKKVIIAAVLLAAVGAGAFFVVKKKFVDYRPRAAELVPAETVLFAQIPDMFTSARRFTKTALWEIFQEPEMQAALGNGDAAEDWRGFARMLPREGFVAITSIDGAIPKFVAGFAFSGRQKDAEAVAAKWRASLRQSRPAGRADQIGRAHV